MYEQRFHPDRAVRVVLIFTVLIHAFIVIYFLIPPTAQTCMFLSLCQGSNG